MTRAHMEGRDSMTARLMQKLLESTYTLNDAYRILLFLEEFLEQVRFGADARGSVAERLSQYSGEKNKEDGVLIEGWGPALLEELAGADVSVQLHALKDALASLPKLVLYVPAVFSSAARDSIGAWCRKKVDERVMLDLRVDPAAAGGCILVWNDTLYDFSLRYFLEKRQTEFRAIIDSYAPTV